MATDTAGRAAMHLHPMSHGEASSGDARKNVAREGMRDLDEKDTQHFAAQNSNIVRAETYKNQSFVNDGNGGFRYASSVDEAVAYQEQRLAKVNRKIADRSMESMDFVVHLPKTMCVEVPNYYPGVRDEKTGKVGKRRSRWIAKDEDEAKRYFEDALEYLQQHVFPGGQASVAWYSMQFDESTPHIQGVSDVFDDDPKKPGTLRISGSRAYMSHRDVVYEDGPKKGKQISGRDKLRGYQTGLREHMISLGYPVEHEVSDRAHESFTKQRYGEIMDRERQQRQQIEDERQRLDADKEELRKKQQWLEDDRAKLEADKERLPELEERAFSEGHKHGYAKGFDEGERDGYEEGQIGALERITEAEQQARDIVQQANAEAERLREEHERLEQENEDKRKEIAGLDETISDRWEELATAGNEVAGKQAELKSVGDMVTKKYQELDAVRAQVDAAKVSRDNMMQFDSDFLDHAMTFPGVPEEYERFKVGRIQGYPAIADGTKEYYERTVAENKRRAQPRGGGNGQPQGQGQLSGGNGKPKGGGNGQPDY